MLLKSKKILTIFILLLLSLTLYSHSVSSQITEKEKIAIINRWHYVLYDSQNMKLFPSIITANMIDPISREILDLINVNHLNNERQIYQFSKWVHDHFTHTQGLSIFKNEVGKDPWGAVSGTPLYKKLIASEMRAMYIYSFKSMTGKCGSLVNEIVSMMRLLGVHSNNTAILRVRGHSFGLVKIEEKLYLINNNNIYPVNQKILNWILDQFYLGLHNDRIAIDKPFQINESTLLSSGFLIDNIFNEQQWNLSNYILIESDITNYDISKPGELFKNKIFQENKFLKLAQYAYQSLYISDPEIYIKASTKGPHLNKLAEDLTNVDDIFNWLQENIESKSIFKFDEDRVMTADQVIVFKKGSNRDQGILIASLLKLWGYNPKLLIAEHNSFIKYEDGIIDVENKKLVDELTTTQILYKLKIE